MTVPLSVPEIRDTIPVSGSVDVVVGGGGPAGIAAATSAARAGAKVLLVEEQGFLGGTGTAAMVTAWNNWERPGAPEMAGIYQELLERLGKIEGGIIGSRDGERQCFYDVEALKYVLDEMTADAGVKVLFHTMIAGAVVDHDRVSGVIVQNKSGRHAILGQVIVDATGDGDIAFSAGVPCTKGREPDQLMQPGTLLMKLGNVDLDRLEAYLVDHPREVLLQTELKQTYDGDIHTVTQMTFGKLPGPFRGRVYWGFPSIVRKAKSEGFPLFTDYVMFHCTPRPDEIVVNMVRVNGVDGTNAESISAAEIEGRRRAQRLVEFFRRYVPGCEECYLMQIAPRIGIRESRRIVGEHVLSQEEVEGGTLFPDTIATAYSTCIDVHDPSGKGFTVLRALEHPVHIPYRCLIPLQKDGLIVAGRCISASHVAIGSIRSQHKVMATGQAAGVAAALCAKHKVQPRGLSVELVQAELRRQGLNFGNEVGIAALPPLPRGRRGVAGT